MAKDFVSYKKGRAVDPKGEYTYHGAKRFPQFYNTLTQFATNSKIVNQLMWDWNELPRFTISGDIDTLDEFLGKVTNVWRDEWNDLDIKDKYKKLDEIVDKLSYNYNLYWERDGKDYTLKPEEEWRGKEHGS